MDTAPHDSITKLALVLGLVALACSDDDDDRGSEGSTTSGAETSGGGASSGATSDGGGSTGDTTGDGSSSGDTSGGETTGGGSTGSAGTTSGDASSTGQCEDPPLVPTTPAPTDAIFLNPERGFYRSAELIGASDLSYVRDQGATLIHSYVRLDDYRTAPLPQSLLDDAAAGFGVARASGIKVVLRFAYNFGPYPDSEPDAPKDWILQHIDQLAPTLSAGSDAIAVVQAGFIGAWGEWHTSTNGLLDNPQDKFDILEALLDALPTTRMVQLRYPPYKHDGYGGPVPEAEAYSGTYAARIGHHNDCFLASDNDWGTYPFDDVAPWKQFAADETRFLAMGGETCNLNPPRSECATALEELELLHFSYINATYLQEVLDSWVAGGCWDEIDRRLGYRLSTPEVAVPAAIPPGAALPVHLVVRNQGYAAPFNPRPMTLVLDGPRWATFTLDDVDPRRFAPGEDTPLDLRLALPGDLPAGTYSIGVLLADPSPALESDSRFAIRLANATGWDDTSGINWLTEVAVDPGAPGCPPGG